MTDHKAVRVRIAGRVQGVFYRAWTEEQARRLELAGFVRNRRDGSVEAVFSGPAGAVDEMVRHCWSGSAGAQVETVETQPAEGIVPERFEVKPTV